MSLSKGVYSIISKRTTGALPDIIGRFPIEDRSLLPKGIFALPDGVRPQYPHWTFTPRGDALEIKALNATVSYPDDKLAACMIPEMGPEATWVATPAGDEDGLYTIELADRSAGWVVSDEETFRGYAIDVKPLSGSNMDTELFYIKRLDSEW